MLNNDLQVYDSCHLKPISIPPRSRLYSLEPIGIGTPYVESLTSYIARLAEAHCLNPKILLTKVINTLNSQSYGNSREFGIRQYSGEINGRGETTSTLVSLLKEITLVRDLECLTLLPLSEILPRKKLIKTTKAWCPFCYQDQVDKNKTLHEPLLWSVDLIKTCPVHKTRLNDSCDNCNKKLPPLSSNSRVGFCPKCGHWLGKKAKAQEKDCSNSLYPESPWHDYVNKNMGNLILFSNQLTKSLSRDVISESLNVLIEGITQGNIAAFSRLMNLPKNSVWMWSKGKSVPQIETLLSVCYRLNLSVVDFIEPARLTRSNLSSIAIHTDLAIKDTRTHKDKTIIDYQSLKDHLESILLDPENNSSVTAIARELGHDRRMLTKKYPDLCHKISQKYLADKNRLSQKRILSYCTKVESLASELYSQGIYPSEVVVSSYLDKPGYFRYKEVRNALKHFQDSHF